MLVARLMGNSAAMVEKVYGHFGNDNYRAAATSLPALPTGSQSVVNR